MQNLAVVYFPNIDLEKINSFRKKYDHNWQIIPPHITIVSPVSDVSQNQFIEHVETNTENVEPFSIHLIGLKKTPDDHLFLSVKEGNEKIVSLHDRLYSGLLSPYIATEFPFVPHITLGEFRTSDNKFDDKLYSQAYIEAQKLNFDMICAFNSISVIKGDGTSPAKIINTINF